MSVFVALFWVIQLQAQNETDKLHRILDSYQRSFSGGKPGDRLSSVLIKGTQTQGDVTYDFLLRKKEPDSLRFRLSNEGASVVCGFNGTIGWQRVERDGKVEILDLPSAELRKLEREADFSGPLIRSLSDQDVAIELLDAVVVNATTAYKLRVEEPGAPTMHYYLATSNYTLMRREVLNASGSVVLTTDYRNYKVVGGFPFAFEVINIIGEMERSVTSIESIEVNPGQLSFYFEKPTY